LLLLLSLGVVAVPGAAGGFLLGSFLIKRLSLSTGQLLRAAFFLSIAGLVSTLMFTVQCDTAPLADESTQRHHVTYT